MTRLKEFIKDNEFDCGHGRNVIHSTRVDRLVSDYNKKLKKELLRHLNLQKNGKNPLSGGDVVAEMLDFIERES